MPTAAANRIEIAYETFGDPADPALLLVMGFGAQMINWEDDFCTMFADRGRFVIRFDNRDVGLSTHLDGVAVDLGAILAAAAGKGEMPAVPYTMTDMAQDGLGLLDHLGIERAHVLGASMGGMIAQQLAIMAPERVITLTSVMSTTGERGYFKSAPAATQALLTPPPTEREAFVAFSAERGAIFSSARYYDRDRAARLAAAAFDRSFYPEGAGRQLAAMQASGHRADGLRTLQVPTLVIHGRADPLIQPLGGERTAELVPGANLLVLHDMAHDLPAPLWPLLVDAVISHTTHAIA